jgi:hypothetical protein
MIPVAVLKQTIAYCARWAPKQLEYKQKTPREPRTSATPCKTMRDRRAKLMTSIEDFASATYPTTFQMATEKTLGQNYGLAFAEILSHLSPNTVSGELSLRAPVPIAPSQARETKLG